MSHTVISIKHCWVYQQHHIWIRSRLLLFKMIGYIAIFGLVMSGMSAVNAETADVHSIHKRQISPTAPSMTYSLPVTSSLGNLTGSDPPQDEQMYPLQQFLECLAHPNPGLRGDCCLDNKEIICLEPVLQHAEDCTDNFYINVQKRVFKCECKATTMECEYEGRDPGPKGKPKRQEPICNRLSRIFSRPLDGLDCGHTSPNVDISTSSSWTSPAPSTSPQTTTSTTRSATQSRPPPTSTQYVTSTTSASSTTVSPGGFEAISQNEADNARRAELIGGVFGGIFIGVFMTLIVLAILLFLCGCRDRINFRKLNEEELPKQPAEETALYKPVDQQTGNYHIYELPDLNANKSNPATGSNMALASGNTKYDNLGLNQKAFKPSARYDVLEVCGTDSPNKVINNEYDHTIISDRDGSSPDVEITVESSRNNPAHSSSQYDVCAGNGSSVPAGDARRNPYSLATAMNSPRSAKETSL